MFNLENELNGILPRTYVSQAVQAQVHYSKFLQQLLEKKCLPDEGLSCPLQFDCLLNELARMDANNFHGQVGVGEREGRVCSRSVARRNGHLAHGIGRSGDIAAVQPKAAGSSLVNRLANALAAHAIRLAGIRSCARAVCFPCASGVCVLLCCTALAAGSSLDRTVIAWALQADATGRDTLLNAAGFRVKHVADETELLASLRDNYGVLCVLVEIHCLPRLDKVRNQLIDISVVVDGTNVQLANTKHTHHIETAFKQLPKCALVLPTAGSFHVPVGSSLVCGSSDAFIDSVAQLYPGRASVSGSFDLLCTLMWLGAPGWKQRLAAQKKALTERPADETPDVSQLSLAGNVELTEVDLPSQLPEQGWSDTQLSHLLLRLASDSVAIGNEDVCRPVSRRYAESNQLMAGVECGWVSDADCWPRQRLSPIYTNTVRMALHSLRLSGLSHSSHALLLPAATGMALLLCLLHFRRLNPAAKYVVWSRIDQKTCIKCIITAGLIPYVVELACVGEEYVTDVTEVERAVQRLGAANVCCVLTTNSCFAPRAPDDVCAVARLCAQHGVPHLVNNAYGLQSPLASANLNKAMAEGRVDMFVQSTDKNWLVPVGGALVCFGGQQQHDMAQLSASFALPALSSSTLLDMLSTLLQLGVTGWQQLHSQRSQVHQYMRDSLSQLQTSCGLRLLHTPHNDISFAVSLDGLMGSSDEQVKQLGSMLFHRRCSGARVNVASDTKSVPVPHWQTLQLQGWGTHSAQPTVCCYLNVAAAIGMERSEVDVFMARLISAVRDFERRAVKQRQQQGSEQIHDHSITEM